MEPFVCEVLAKQQNKKKMNIFFHIVDSSIINYIYYFLFYFEVGFLLKIITLLII